MLKSFQKYVISTQIQQTYHHDTYYVIIHIIITDITHNVFTSMHYPHLHHNDIEGLSFV